MTYRIDFRPAADGHRLEVHGLVDAAALAAIRAALRVGGAGKLRVVLERGCEVDHAVLEELGRLPGVELVAESPFLARWLGRI